MSQNDALGAPTDAETSGGGTQTREARTTPLVETLAWPGLRVAVLANAVGRGEGGGPDLARLAKERIAALGGLVMEIDAGADVGAQMTAIRAASPGPDVIVAAGGDGTINAGAALAMKTGASLVILPAGTMNLVARDLDMPLDPLAIIERFERLTLRVIDSAGVNEHVFLHSSLMGLVPAMAVLRERMRSQKGLIARARTLMAMGRVAFAAPKLRLRLETPEGSRVLSTRSLAVSCNLLAGDAWGSLKRTCLTGCLLGVYVSAHRGRLAPLQILASMATGRLPKDPETLSFQCASLRVESRRRFMRLSNDGEVAWVGTPLLFRVLPASLRVAVAGGDEQPAGPTPTGSKAGDGPIVDATRGGS